MSKRFLVTAASGDTGYKTLKLLLEQGHGVKALVRKRDARAIQIESDGAELFVGDISNLNDMRAATFGVDGAYYCYPLVPGIVQGTAFFAQAARENGLSAIVNMSQISARSDARSTAAQNHWVAEQLLNWSGVPVTHIRPTFFAEWLLYLAPAISQGYMPTPFTGRHAPIASEDQARVIANILSNPKEHAGKIYPLFGPVEFSQEELAAEVGRALGTSVTLKNLDVDAFMSYWKSNRVDKASVNGISKENAPSQDDLAAQQAWEFFVQHIREVSRDHAAGFFSGTNDVVREIGGVPGTTVEDFVKANYAAFAKSVAASK